MAVLTSTACERVESFTITKEQNLQRQQQQKTASQDEDDDYEPEYQPMDVARPRAMSAKKKASISWQYSHRQLVKELNHLPATREGFTPSNA
jgi:hypothetical protein